MIHRLRSAFFLALTLPALAGGCLTTSSFGPAPHDAHKVKIEGNCLELADPTSLSFDGFLRVLTEHLAADRRHSAYVLFERFPEHSAALAGRVADAGPIADFLQTEKMRPLLSDASPRRQSAERFIQRALRGPSKDAAQAWREAARALVHPHLLADPVLFEKWVEARPTNTDWPTETFSALRPTLRDRIPSEALDKDRGDGVVWLAIGSWRLQRGEFRRALSAFKQSEAMGDECLKGWALLHQAEAMKSLDQSASAATVLASLAERADPVLRRAAWSKLGGFKLQDGHTQQALVFLTKALDGKASFPGSGIALADLGITLLTLGQDENGLDYLHRAQEVLSRQGQTEVLLASLENELRFHEHLNNADSREKTRERIRQIEASTHPSVHRE